MNNKGFIQQLYVILILLGVLILVVSGIWLWLLSAPLFTSLSGTVLSEVNTSMSQETDGNLSGNTATVVNMATTSLNQFEWITYVCIFALMITFIIMCFYVRQYKFLLGIWISAVFILGIFSLYLTQAYTDMTHDNSILESSANSWSTGNFIMSNFPTFVVGIGILGGIILVFLISREPEAEAQSI